VTAHIGYRRTGGDVPYWDGLLIEYDQADHVHEGYKNAVLADNPTGYWRLGETTGTTATATIGSVNGTYTNAPQLGGTGAVNDTDTATSFDGTNDYISMGDNYAYSARAAFSVEAWIRPTAATASWRRILSKEAANADGWDLHLQATTATPNRLAFERHSSGASDLAYSNVALTAGLWYHIAATYDGTTMTLYVNGSAQSAPVSSTRSLPAVTDPFLVGAGNGGTNPVGGQLDEVAVYSGTTLSAARIQAHHAARSPYQTTVLADSPSSYWRLGESTGNGTAGAAAGTYTGTYTNGPLLGLGGAVGDGDTATYFDGSNDYVTYGDIYGFTGTAAFTAEAWVRTLNPVLSGNPGIVGKFDNQYNGWGLALTHTGYPPGNAPYGLRKLNGTTLSQNLGTIPTEGTHWYHLVFTYNGTTGLTYVNGTLDSTAASSVSVPSVADQLVTGIIRPGAADLFNGGIDEVAIYSGVALSQARIQAHYNAGRP
jgi:hypothetical protein